MARAGRGSVRAVRAVVLDVLGEHDLQVATAEDEHPVEALAPDGELAVDAAVPKSGSPSPTAGRAWWCPSGCSLDRAGRASRSSAWRRGPGAGEARLPAGRKGGQDAGGGVDVRVLPAPPDPPGPGRVDGPGVAALPRMAQHDHLDGQVPVAAIGEPDELKDAVERPPGGDRRQLDRGRGPEVEGRAIDLLLLVANRGQVLGSLAGPGAATL